MLGSSSAPASGTVDAAAGTADRPAPCRFLTVSEVVIKRHDRLVRVRGVPAVASLARPPPPLPSALRWGSQLASASARARPEASGSRDIGAAARAAPTLQRSDEGCGAAGAAGTAAARQRLDSNSAPQLYRRVKLRGPWSNKQSVDYFVVGREPGGATGSGEAGSEVEGSAEAGEEGAAGQWAQWRSASQRPPRHVTSRRARQGGGGG